VKIASAMQATFSSSSNRNVLHFVLKYCLGDHYITVAVCDYREKFTTLHHIELICLLAAAAVTITVSVVANSKQKPVDSNSNMRRKKKCRDNIAAVFFR